MKIFSFTFLSLFAIVGPLVAGDCTTDPGAATADGPVNAAATFSFGDNGVITVSLTNQLADPKSAGQLLSGLQFTLASGLTSGTLQSDSAIIRRVSRATTYSDQAMGPMGWALDNTNGFLLCALCNDLGAMGPHRLLIGAPNGNVYTSANSSIAGNRPHNPFTAGTATFFIEVPGATSADSVNSVTFFFGTAGGASGVPGVGVAVPASCGPTVLPS